MSPSDNINNDPLIGFKSLYSAVIDASSIIYMHKSDFFMLAAKYVQLHSPREAIIETGLIGLPVVEHELDLSSHNESTDNKLIQLAVKLKIPVISEDKKVLKMASKKGLPYFNSLMVLCYLLYKGYIKETAFEKHYQILLSVCRYSSFVIEYGNMIKRKIMMQKAKQ